MKEQNMMQAMGEYLGVNFLEHYGVSVDNGAPGVGSGRYPKGSGENPYQRNVDFLSNVYRAREQGLSDTEIAKGMGMTTTVFRSSISLANSEIRKANVARALELKEAGYSNVEIGREMGINESSVRSLLNPALSERSEIARTTANVLKDAVDSGKYIDIGVGTEYQMGISRTKLKTAIELLEEDGYSVHNIQIEQLGTGNKTTVQVLAPEGTTKKDIYQNLDKIQTIVPAYSEDGGRSFEGLETPRSVDSKRIDIVYAEQGGTQKDGVIEVRPGVPELDMGDANYCQVRIAVDGTHYLKGMCVYNDNLPEGIDIRFNTNKHVGTPMLGESSDTSVLKPMKDDPDNPFGSTVRQKHYTDADGKDQLSALNIVYEEGEWSTWSKTLSSQMLSKQQPALAKQQLEEAYKEKLDIYNENNSITMPALKQKLMAEFADECDAAAVDLSAAGMPRQASHVILPIPSLRDNEIYAPNYRNGETVVLIRYPHGGKFEIPELTVNNKNREAIDIMGNAIDAVGINAKVAERLSGADFDGDTVLVIPNNDHAVRTSPALKGLKDFDPKESYRNPPGAPKTGKDTGFLKQRQMGDVSNLITDMTIKGATNDEIARAVRHSMVVIDAEKHNLNWRQSAIDNGIAELKTKYQGGPKAGASTLISRSTSEARVLDRKAKPLSQMTDEERARYYSGEKIWQETGRTYMKPIKDKKTGEIKGYKETPKMQKSTKGAETDDARKLSSGTLMEEIYAAHANRLKALAKRARAIAITTPSAKYNPSAKKTYAREVASLMAKLNTALKHSPYERQAQIMANIVVKAKKKANPGMDNDKITKLKGRALTEARKRCGGGKELIDISEREWEAIQAGALSHNRQVQILNNANPDRLKELALPRDRRGLSSTKKAQARSMLNRGYSRSEVAEFFGISTSTLTKELNGD